MTDLIDVINRTLVVSQPCTYNADVQDYTNASRTWSPESTKHMAHGARDKEMTWVYKVILTSRLPSAKLISSITAASSDHHHCWWSSSTQPCGHKIHKDYTQNDLFYTSWLVISKFSLECTLRMQYISTMVVWALIYQDFKICSVIPSRLFEHAINKYGTVAAYFGIGKMIILKIMRWNIYMISAQQNVYCIITHYFLGCCGIEISWKLSAEWDVMNSC